MNENKVEAAHTSIWQSSEAIISIILLLGLILEFFVLDLNLSFASLWVRVMTGAVLIVSGVLIVVFAKREFDSANQPTSIGKQTTKIVDTGVFSLSRNPIYLGIALVTPGIGIVFNFVWLIILTLPMMLIVYWVLIRPEEAYLVRLFGDDYKQYVQKVRRWI